MRNKRPVVVQYSVAFKRKIVSEIENGKHTISSARKMYDIRGAETIQKWLKNLGKCHLLNDIIRVQMKDEKDKLRSLEREIQLLKTQLADEYLKNKALEKVIELADKEYDTDLKKNSGLESSKFLGKKKK